jgi:hypothetical protein
VRKDHPLRAVRTMTDEILKRSAVDSSREVAAGIGFADAGFGPVGAAADGGDRLQHSRCFVGLNLDEQVWDATSFTKNRDRLEAAVAREFLTQVAERARAARLISDKYFTVDGTLLEAWASLNQRRVNRIHRPMIPVIRRWTFMARSPRTKHTSRRPIRTHFWHAREKARRPF